METFNIKMRCTVRNINVSLDIMAPTRAEAEQIALRDAPIAMPFLKLQNLVIHNF